MQWRLQ